MKHFLCITATLTHFFIIFIFPNNSFGSSTSFHNGMSLQGFTGILNTPNAHVTPQGDFYALYSNQIESKWKGNAPSQDNYSFNIGLFNFMELGGTMFDVPRKYRDLSASFKLTSEPFFNHNPYMPVFALGMQDISGGASLLKTKYAVISEDIWRLRGSVGYGTGPDHIDGLFAGGEFKVCNWFYLLADYDTVDTNAGIRAVLPRIMNIPINVTATAKTSLNNKPGNIDFGLGFTLPLDFNFIKHPETPALYESSSKSVVEKNRTVENEPLKTSTDLISTPTVEKKPTPSLANLRERLIKVGFTNVRIGYDSETKVVVEYENQIFNHNELDALGVVLGTAYTTLKDSNYQKLTVIIRKKDIQMMQVTVKIDALGQFLESPTSTDSFANSMEISTTIDDPKKIQFIEGDNNSSLFSTSLILWPGLNTLVGIAENGGAPFEYRLSLKPELYVNLWKGGMLSARWDIPVSWSDKMDDGKMDSSMERLMLFQGVRLFPKVMLNLGGGMVWHDKYGTMNELVWQPGDGRHRIRASQTITRDNLTHKNQESYLASYLYYFTPLDLSLEGNAGKFLSEDKGFSIILKRYFGDTSFSIYYKNSTTEDKKRWQAGGVQFSFPLTFEKDMKHIAHLQVRGTEEWNYSQETTFKNRNSPDAVRRGALNYTPNVPLAVSPILTGSLYNQYMNRDRLSETYIVTHTDRIKSAWLKYRSIVH